MEALDYLAIGHISQDITAEGSSRPGGSVAYAGLAARALGCRTAVVTSAATTDLATILPGLCVHCIPAGQTTTFENIYTPAGRTQILHHTAAPLGSQDIPAGWDRATIVHLAPVAREVDPDLVYQFSNSLIGLTPQGWMRQWDESGRVTPCPWPLAEFIFPLAAAVIISTEDLPDSETLALFRQWARLLVVTAGPAGCTVYMGDESWQVPAPAVIEREPTGAGDIFAAAFLLRLLQTRGNPTEAARFANEAAAHSVTQPDLLNKVQYLEKVYGREQGLRNR